MYQCNTDNGYIVSLVAGVSNSNITREQYEQIKEALKNRPEAPEGYFYRLKTDLTWELCDFPHVTDEELDEHHGTEYSE